MRVESSSRARAHVIDYGSVVVVLVVGALSLAAVFFTLTEHAGHAHAVLSAAQKGFAYTVDTFGLALMFMAAVQMMLGYRLLHFRPSLLRSTHVSMAWWIVGVVTIHMVGAIVHSLFQGPIQTLPLVSDAIGLLSIAVLAGAITSGYRRMEPGAARARYVHSWVAVTLALVLSVHGIVGVIHTVSG